MATKKITNITRADLASLIEGYSASQNKVGVLSKSDVNTQSKEPAADSQSAEPSQPSQPAEKPTEPLPISAKRISQKQRKASLEEYKNSFLVPPKITDRKTVYLSAETRDRLDEIVRRLGERGSSVSGFIENMAKEHLETYRDEIEQWKRL
jgi:hypothetical protein